MFQSASGKLLQLNQGPKTKSHGLQRYQSQKWLFMSHFSSLQAIRQAVINLSVESDQPIYMLFCSSYVLNISSILFCVVACFRNFNFWYIILKSINWV